MNLGVPVALAIALAIGAGAVAAWSGPNLAVSVPAGALAAAGAALAGVLLLAERVRWPPVVRPPAVEDSYGTLYQSFRTGLFGRERILAAVQELDRDSGTAPRAGRTLEEEAEILHLDPDRFLEWVERALDRVEAAA